MLLISEQLILWINIIVKFTTTVCNFAYWSSYLSSLHSSKKNKIKWKSKFFISQNEHLHLSKVDFILRHDWLVLSFLCTNNVYNVYFRAFQLGPVMHVILMGNFRFWRAKKMPNLDHKSYNFLIHFGPFWMGTHSKMMGNFNILAKAMV